MGAARLVVRVSRASQTVTTTMAQAGRVKVTAVVRVAAVAARVVHVAVADVDWALAVTRRKTRAWRTAVTTARLQTWRETLARSGGVNNISMAIERESSPPSA